MSILYTADSHLGHANIIRYCNRPFATVEAMDATIAGHLADAAASGQRIIHAGDMSFNFGKYVREHGPLWTKHHDCDHTFVAGNHDDFAGHKKLAYLTHFPIVVGLPKEWKKNVYLLQDTLDNDLVNVIVSHAPIPWDKLREGFEDGRVVNVHGHIHNNALQAPDNKESGWTLKSPIHFNAGVELHGYKPVSLQSLADEHRRGYSNSRASALGDGSEFGLDSELPTL